jgi:uncharacterized protein
MPRLFARLFRRVGAFGALASLATTGCSTTIIQAPSAVPEGVVVVGIGKATGAPDIARINVGVETRGQSVEQATAETTRRVDAMLAAFATLGIAKSDLRTHSYFVQYEQMHYPPYPPEPMPERGAVKDAPADAARPRGEYRVQNMVEVTVRDLDRVGAVLAAATDAGANVMWGIDFQLEDLSPLEATAREGAVADAQARAEQLARLAGIALGPVLSVTEVGAGGPVPFPGPMPMAAMKLEMDRSAPVPIERGEVRVERGVQIVYGPARRE